MLSAQEIEEAVRRFRSGETILSIASMLEMDRRRVRKLLHDRGVGVTRPQLTESQLGQVATLYAEGMSLAEVGKRVGVTANAVRYRLVQRGVCIRPRRGFPVGTEAALPAAR